MSQSYRSRSANSRGSSGYSKGSRGRSGGSRVTMMVVVLVLILVVGAGIVYALNQGGAPNGNPGGTNNNASNNLDSNTFYNGVYVDDIALGGLTQVQAKQQIEAKQKTLVANTGVTIASDTQNIVYKIADMPYTFDTDTVLGKAWSQGRTGTDDDRKAAISNLPANPVKLKTTVTVDYSKLEAKVRELAAPYAVAAVDAAYADYDPTKPVGQRLTFTADKPGSQVDADALWAAVKAEFDNNTFGTVPMQVVPVPAAITMADLQSNMQLIGSFVTQIKNHSTERLTNIRLASAAINGKFILPGDTFSMNDTTGERTAAMGYQKAPIDANGIDDVGLGGGVCQVSGTLYNAAIAAGPNLIDIVERNHHSIPSKYMAKGTDATVDYGHFDLKIKNISDKPMLLIEYYAKDTKGVYHEYAEIYGTPDPEGATYKLQGVITQTIPADTTSPTVYVPNSAVLPGAQKSFPAHDGYVVDVFLVKTAKDGTVTKTKLYTDTYKASGNIIAYYKSDPVPTPTPSPSPTPAETPTPPPTATLKPTATPTPASSEVPAG